MALYSDNDIKIAGDKPSVDIKKNRESAVSAPKELDAQDTKNAKELGRIIAEKFIKDARDAETSDEGGDLSDFEMIIQRRLLLSFTATVGFEEYCADDTLAGIAQKSFIDTVKKTDNELYKSSSDTGAFSFYYVAYRRGSEIDRRMGQTFAMLCAHDGDPVYQELGEALYCWFMSAVKKNAEELNLI
ncbi:MAG: hypothetical protein U0L66_04865 [Acutalibacteraceae bacterium]|nr:hypothetical protein [Acutalibacteraceae bacterium]